MNKISIQQDNSKNERTKNSLIDYLYFLDKRESENNTDINFTGSLVVQHAYGDAVEYLTNKHNDFYINITDGTYIRFKDSSLANALIPFFSSDGVGITYTDAQNVLSLDPNHINAIPKTITSFDELQYFYVTSLYNNSFKDDTLLESINLKRIQDIGDYSFLNTQSLTNIGDTSNIKVIRGAVFRSSGIGGDLSFPLLERIGDYAFAYCTNITSVSFGPNFTGNNYFINSHAFDGCTSLEHIYNYSNITKIGNVAFKDTSLRSFDFSNIVTIDDNAFENTKLTSIELTNNMTSIGNGAFARCKELETVSILGSIESTGYDIFRECTALKTADISGLTNASQFDGCTSLETLTLNPGMTTNLNCQGCVNLDTINNQSSIKSINERGLYNCVKISSVDLTNCTTIGKYAFIGTSLDNVDISACTSLGNSAFDGLKTLVSVKLCPDLKTLNGSVFKNCSNLSNININSAVITSIGSSTFEGCKLLTTFDVSSVMSLDWWSFAYCDNLATLNLSSSITNIPSQCFRNNPKLTSVGDLSGVKTIEKQAFLGCPLLTGPLNLSNCETIDDNAFNGCTSLTEVTLSTKCTVIKGNAFNNCTNLESVGDLSNVTKLGTHFANDMNTFRGCSSLVSVNLSNKCTLLCGNTFRDCTSLTSVGDISGLTDIYGGTFQNCSSLTQNFDLSNITGAIGENAFNGCSSLTSILVGANVQKIDQYAFQNCPALTVKFLGTTPVPDFAINAFNSQIYKILVPSGSLNSYKAKISENVHSKIETY